MDELTQKILTSIRTIDERDETRMDLEALKESLYKPFPQEFHSVLANRFSSRIGGLLREWFDRPSYLRNPSLITADIDLLTARVKAMRVLRLEVAIEPNASFVDHVSQWATVNIGSDIVLDIVEEKSVVGGARIVFGGRYKENTILEMIKDVFEKKREMIEKELQ